MLAHLQIRLSRENPTESAQVVDVATVEDVGATLLKVLNIPLHPKAEGTPLKQIMN